MAAIQKTTPEVPAEAESFIVGLDHHDNPITKPVCDMSEAEQCQALAIARAEMERTAAEAEYILPLAEIDYLPASLEMCHQLLDRLLPAVEARERALRLANAVQAMGAH
jgi:hypothetical protein